MSTFDQQDLFATGPHRFHVGGVALRCVLQPAPDAPGVQLAPQGTTGRAIAQTGDLIADDPAALRALAAAIEAKLDGLPHELVDDLGRSWPGVVMLSFEPQPARRLGPRHALAYRVQYVQLTP